MPLKRQFTQNQNISHHLLTLTSFQTQLRGLVGCSHCSSAYNEVAGFFKSPKSLIRASQKKSLSHLWPFKISPSQLFVSLVSIHLRELYVLHMDSLTRCSITIHVHRTFSNLCNISQGFLLFNMLWHAVPESKMVVSEARCGGLNMILVSGKKLRKHSLVFSVT